MLLLRGATLDHRRWDRPGGFNEIVRSTGAGSRMIAWLKVHALEQGCGQILDSGVQRFPAHRFYLREGFDISSHHFSITDLGRGAP